MESNDRPFKSRREIVSLLQDFMRERNYNSNSLARAVAIPQSTVYRALAPNTGRVNETHLALCVYASIDPYAEREVHPERSQVLMSVLCEVWDGTERHARALARLLRSARDVRDRSFATSRLSARGRGK